MDAVIKGKAKAGDDPFNRPSRDEAEDAVRTLIAWAGDDPRRGPPTVLRPRGLSVFLFTRRQALGSCVRVEIVCPQARD